MPNETTGRRVAHQALDVLIDEAVRTRSLKFGGRAHRKQIPNVLAARSAMETALGNAIAQELHVPVEEDEHGEA